MGNFTTQEKYKICRDFGLKIFTKADAEDRAGKADKGTARTFYAAASFLDILKQFQSEEELGLEDALEEGKKSFYAKWKSTDILKAIKEGREVKPGGYGEDVEDDEDVAADADAQVEEGTEVEKDGSMRNLMPPPPAYADSAAYNPPPVAPSQKLSFDLPPPVPTKRAPEPEEPVSSVGGFLSNFFGMGAVNGKYDKATLADARELAKFALSALGERDAAFAETRLKQALATLGQDAGGGGGANRSEHEQSSLAGAKESTKLAIKALDNKDGALAGEKLKQALKCL